MFSPSFSSWAFLIIMFLVRRFQNFILSLILPIRSDLILGMTSYSNSSSHVPFFLFFWVATVVFLIARFWIASTLSSRSSGTSMLLVEDWFFLLGLSRFSGVLFFRSDDLLFQELCADGFYSIRFSRSRTLHGREKLIDSQWCIDSY